MLPESPLPPPPHFPFPLPSHTVPLLGCFSPTLAILVPRSIPSFSMLHAEKQEGLVHKNMCDVITA